jgi:hypothetical protein
MAKCECECGQEVAGQGHFIPGHDQTLRVSLEQMTGGLLPLRDLVKLARGYFEGTLTEENFTQKVRSIFARELKSKNRAKTT